MRRGPPRLLLAETLRLSMIATRLLPGFDPAEAVRALRDDTNAPEPSLFERIRARRTWMEIARPYGQVWTFRRYPFFATEPIPFMAVRCPNERPAVLFERSPRRDFYPYAARLAVDRLCMANGWRFPEDLVEPNCGDAVWDLLWIGAPDPHPAARVASFARQTKLAESGALIVDVKWSFDGAEDRVWWRWDAHRLDRGSLRFDGAPPAEA